MAGCPPLGVESKPEPILTAQGGQCGELWHHLNCILSIQEDEDSDDEEAEQRKRDKGAAKLEREAHHAQMHPGCSPCIQTAWHPDCNQMSQAASLCVQVRRC